MKVLIGLTLLAAAACGAGPAAARPVEPIAGEATEPAGPGSVDSRWGGHLKIRGSASRHDETSLYGLVESGTYLDGGTEARLTNRTFLTESLSGEIHYEVLASGGDTMEAEEALGRMLPDAPSTPFLQATGRDDGERFLDLAHSIRRRDGFRLRHRLDRLSLAWSSGRSSVRVGRQAVTWGNGLLFNPMDLVNPFAPTDIEREYKAGGDMVAARFPAWAGGEAEVIYVPRRAAAGGEPDWDRSTLAAKADLFRGTLELDLTGALHYGEEVVGIGAVGYVRDAAWRADAAWTFAGGPGSGDGFLSLAANVDYSWYWWGRNIYGFLELFYNGMGREDPVEALSRPGLMDRLGRGELFTLGRIYLAGHIRVEAHPLLNAYLTVIHNVEDSSGLVQPRAVWDASSDVRLTLGASVPYGGTGTEFGGFRIPGTGASSPASASIFLWAARYF